MASVEGTGNPTLNQRVKEEAAVWVEEELGAPMRTGLGNLASIPTQGLELPTKGTHPAAHSQAPGGQASEGKALLLHRAAHHKDCGVHRVPAMPSPPALALVKREVNKIHLIRWS